MFFFKSFLWESYRALHVGSLIKLMVCTPLLLWRASIETPVLWVSTFLGARLLWPRRKRNSNMGIYVRAFGFRAVNEDGTAPEPAQTSCYFISVRLASSHVRKVNPSYPPSTAKDFSSRTKSMRPQRFVLGVQDKAILHNKCRACLGGGAIPSDGLLQLSGAVVPYLQRGVRSPSSELHGRDKTD